MQFRVFRQLLFVTLVLWISVCLPLIVDAQEQARHDDLYSVSFFADQAWACGYWGTIVHTGDGGKTWTRQKSPTDYSLTSISFVDDRYGWAVGDGGIILNTKDGGVTWTHQKSPEDIFLMGIHFVTREKGWAVGERMTIIATSDGGITWTTQYKGDDYILKSVSFADEQNGWVVGEYGFIYHTTDGGKTWKHEAGEFGFSEETGQVVGGHYLFDVVAVDKTTAWAVGIDGYVTVTRDGTTWQQVKTSIPRVHLFGVAADQSGRVVITGKGTLISSNDHGATWQTPTLISSIEYGWLYGATIKSVVGSAGAIYMNSNAGLWARAKY